MKTVTVFLAVLVASMIAADGSPLQAQEVPKGKEVFISRELARTNIFSDTSLYSISRSKANADLIVLWERGFGFDPARAPQLNGKTMNIDVDRMLRRTQYFYDYFVDTLKWLLPGSKTERYKMMLMVRYNEDGTAYGGAHDNTIGGLWVSPSRLQDTVYNVLAHELGHSFQAQLGADGTQGLNQGAMWEMTSQWMLWQVNPYWVQSEEYHWTDFMLRTNYSFCHRENIYHSPYVLEYLSNKHGQEYIGKIWREAQQGEDVASAHIRMAGLTQQQFNNEIYDAAARFVTYDMPRVRSIMKPYANRHHCKMIDGGRDLYYIAPERTLGAYGYNAIRLEVPQAGKTAKIQLRPDSLTKGATGGWNYGLVAVAQDGTPTYTPLYYVDAKKGGKTISYKVSKEQPAYLWLVVSSAPATHSLNQESGWYAHFKMTGTKPHADMLNARVVPFPQAQPQRRRRAE